MTFSAAPLPEDLDLAGLLEALFRRLRAVCPDCAAEVPDGDEVGLARRIVAAVADPASSTGLAPDQLSEVEAAVGELVASEDPDALLAGDPRFESPLVARLLIRRARTLAGSRSRDGVRVASLAIRSAERVSSYLWGRDYARTTLLQARCSRVEALRAAGRLEEAHREVEHLLDSLEPDVLPRLRGDLHLLAGQVRLDQGELGDAAGLLFVAREVYEASRDAPRLGRTVLRLAEVYRETGQIDLAVDSARRATELLDPAEEPQAHASARHNLAIYLCDAGRPFDARAELEASRSVKGFVPPRATHLRSRWIEGRIHEQVGDWETAERLYREVQRHFAQGNLPIDASLASIDLAWLLVERKRYPEAFAVSSWLGIHFRRHDFPLPVLTALLGFREALRASPLDPEELFAHLATLRALLRRSSSLGP